MLYLLGVSIVWAFSFGLTKGRLAGLDSTFVSAARLGLALLVFLPFIRPGQHLGSRGIIRLAGIGALQFGVMYLALNESYRHLAAHEVALFTLTTPVLVSLVDDALARSFRARALLAAVLAVASAAVVVAGGPSGSLVGVFLVQIANLAFAVGQVLYRRMRLARPEMRDRDVFGILYIGAFAVAAPFALVRGGPKLPSLTTTQLETLVYLGVLASGLGFFAWNFGATKVNAGTLAVFNNAKVPLGVACSLVVFGEKTDLVRLAIAGVLFTAAVTMSRENPPRRVAAQ